MANYIEIFRRNGSITIDEVYNFAQEINKDIFKGTLPIEKGDDYISFIGNDKGFNWWLQSIPHIKYDNYNSETDSCDETEDAKNYIEFKDCPSPDYLRWIQEILIKEVINRTDIVCHMDSIGEYLLKSSPYPKTYKEYITRSFNIPSESGIVKKFVMSRSAKSNYKFWKSIATEGLPTDLFNLMFGSDFIK